MGKDLILETERLILRPFTLADVDAMEAVLGDQVAMQFYPAPFTRQDVEEWIRKNLARYEKDGCGKNAMVLKQSGEVIGGCGCCVQSVEGRDQIEVGYNVRRNQWGKGYATEAARSCIDYAFFQLGTKRVISMIRPENTSSRRVAEKNGLVCEKVVFWRDYDHCIYAKHRV